jgi:hypothetical protein
MDAVGNKNTQERRWFDEFPLLFQSQPSCVLYPFFSVDDPIMILCTYYVCYTDEIQVTLDKKYGGKTELSEDKYINVYIMTSSSSLVLLFIFFLLRTDMF